VFRKKEALERSDSVDIDLLIFLISIRIEKRVKFLSMIDESEQFLMKMPFVSKDLKQKFESETY
jgi:hypothetical protein